MSHNKDYTITSLSGNMEQYEVSNGTNRAPIIPTGRIRQSGSVGVPYVVTKGENGTATFPFGKSS